MATTYQWRRCDSAGASCVDIGGATASTYTLTVTDVGHTIRVVASDGTSTVTSDQTAVIAASAPASGVWAWDAQAATVSSNTGTLVARVSAPAANAAYFAATVAHATAPGGTTAYAIPSPYIGLDATVPVPLGTKHGPTSDQHLYVIDATSREHDLWLANYNTSTQRISSVGGGVSFPSSAVYEPSPGQATAARFPLSRGLVTPADVVSGTIAHPLVMAIPLSAVNGPPCVYPANTTWNDPVVPYGQWYRLDPSVNVAGLGLDSFNTMICVALQKYGAFVRDESGTGNNTIALFGTDEINQSGNAAWPVSLPIKNGAGYPYAVKLSSSIPWSRLQALQPPPP